MRWTIDSKAHDGLKVISEIPEISPCLLEGQNGIGKTVAIQLLELISGEIPDDFRRRPTLWNSLRLRLGSTTVAADQLHGGRSLSLTFTPESWDAELPDSVGEWLGTATIDGQPASVEECASLVSVTRIAGDEDLEDTLRRRVETLSAYLRSAADMIRARGDQIEAELGDVRGDLDRADPSELETEGVRLASVEDELASVERDAALADERLTRLLRALETKRQLHAAGEETQALLARREQLLVEVKRLGEELDLEEKKAEAADQAFSAEGDTEKKLSDAERLLRHRRSRLSNLEREIDDAASGMSVSAEAGAVALALRECESQLQALAASHQELDATSLVRDLIGELVVPLEAARDAAGNQILVQANGIGLTVSETLAGVTKRRGELADQPQPAQLRELAAQIDEAKRRQIGLRELASKLQQYEQQQERVAQAEAEAASAADQAVQASEAASRSREANQAVGAAQAALTKAHSELASVQQQIGTTGVASKEDAEADLRSALAELGLEETELTNAEGTARAAVAEADRKMTEMAATASAIRRRVTTRRTDIDLLIERLRDSQRYAWLVNSTPGLSVALTDPVHRYEAFGALRAAVLQATESAFEAAQFLTGLEGTAEAFFTSGVDDDGDARDLAQSLRPVFEQVLGHRLRETLNSQSIREAIFDGGEVVRIEPSSRQLTLRDGEGNETHRPMEAFSTGERAFAFTQARIADLEASEKPNRLLVLDEFGAFVAADRLPDLAAFLASDTQRVADQVVVILPLHVDYQAEIGDTRGDLRSRYRERLTQINERGYCAVKLE